VILVDANLLIYAIDADSPHNARARAWLESTLSGTRTVAIPWVVILAFLRVTTNPRVMRKPLPIERAIHYVESWLHQPCVTALAPGAGHWPILCQLLRQTGSAGNLTSDADITALALENGASVYSADHDFQRFPGIRHINPLLQENGVET